MQIGRLMLFLLFLQVTPVYSQDKTFIAQVVRIIDGDTMEVLYQKKPIKVRLAHIDSPEKRGSQPYGSQAKQALSDLCFNQEVTVYGKKTDRNGRLIAVIKNQQKQIVNQEMVKQGMAWHFKKYSTDPIYTQLEQTARKNKLGLWADKNPIAPWLWRKQKHVRKKSSRSIAAQPADA